MEFTKFTSTNKVSIIGSLPNEFVESFFKSTHNTNIIDIVSVVDTSGSMGDVLGTNYNQFPGIMSSLLQQPSTPISLTSLTNGISPINTNIQQTTIINPTALTNDTNDTNILQPTIPPIPTVKFNINTNYNNNSNKISKYKIIEQSINKCIDYMKILAQNNHKIRFSLITFKETPQIVFDKLFINDSEECEKELSKLNKALLPYGGTDIYKALLKTKELIDSILETNTIDNVNVFMMTDGYNSNINENEQMINFFKSYEHNNKFIGMGIGNATDYDNKLLDSLFVNMKGSPSSQELTDNVISDTFGACSTVIKNLNITFYNFDKAKYYTPVEFESIENKLIFKSSSVDFSQKFVFSFENSSGFETPILMEVSYDNCITNEKVHEIFKLDNGIVDNDTNDKIYMLCKLITKFKNLVKDKVDYDINKKITDEILQGFSSWNKEDRKGIIADMWNSNETIVTNHKNELEKYTDINSYTAYTTIVSKQTSNTINVGRTPSLSRQVSEGVTRQYSTMVPSTRLTSCPIPENYSSYTSDSEDESVGPIGPGHVLKRQVAVSYLTSSYGIEEDEKNGYNPNTINLDSSK